MEAVLEPNTDTPTSVPPAGEPATQAAIGQPAPVQYDVIVIGGGPSGMAACIYLARKKLKTLLITKDVGGQTAWSSDVENYLGYTMITGAELTKHFQDHLSNFKEEVTLKLAKDGVQSLSRSQGGFSVQMMDGTILTARSMIISSGKTPKQLGIDGEAEFLHRGVTYCAWCDGPLFKGKAVAIIGGGNSALDAAFAVEKIATEIYIVNTLPDLTADEVMIEKAIASPKIRVMNNTQALTISGETSVQGLTVRDSETGKDKELAVEGILIEIGAVPADDFVKGFVELNDQHEIVIDKHNMTSVEGVFAAGDVTDIEEKQIIIAAGEGAKAAIRVSKWLSRTP